MARSGDAVLPRAGVAMEGGQDAAVRGGDGRERGRPLYAGIFDGSTRRVDSHSSTVHHSAIFVGRD